MLFRSVSQSRYPMLCHENIRKVLAKKKVGEKLTALECHDICCFIADAVLAGGVRRSACMAIFDKDDDEMLNCKSGDWWKDNPQRARANNSVALPYYETSQEEFYLIMDRIRDSKSGEPGIFWTYDRNILQNPCGEVSLKPRQFCNLVEINMGNYNSDSENDDSHKESAQAASFIATVQATYTDFPSLS